MGLFAEMNEFFVHKRITKEVSLIGRTSLVLSLLFNKEPILMTLFDSPSPKKGSEIYRAIGNLRIHLDGHTINAYLSEALIIGSLSLLLSIVYLYIIEPHLIIEKLYSQRLKNGLERSKIRQDMANERIQNEVKTLTAIDPIYAKIEKVNKTKLANLIIQLLGEDRPGVHAYDPKVVGIARSFNFLAASQGTMTIGQSDVTEEGRAFVQRFAQDESIVQASP
jgi:hypothetical protein